MGDGVAGKRSEYMACNRGNERCDVDGTINIMNN